jgi:hypothetical protein
MQEPRPAPERQVVPAVRSLRALLTEPVRVECERVVPQRGITMRGVDRDDGDRAGFQPVAVDLDVLHDRPAQSRCRRAQSQCLMQHLHRVAQSRHVLRGQPPIAELADLGGARFCRSGR